MQALGTDFQKSGCRVWKVDLVRNGVIKNHYGTVMEVDDRMKDGALFVIWICVKTGYGKTDLKIMFE